MYVKYLTGISGYVQVVNPVRRQFKSQYIEKCVNVKTLIKSNILGNKNLNIIQE